LITFSLFDYPLFQVLAMTVLNLVYMCYISHFRIHEWTWQKTLEVVNEFIFVIICYLFLLFCGFLDDNKARDIAGDYMRVLVFILIGLNSLIILVVSFQGARRKIELKRMKKEHQN